MAVIYLRSADGDDGDDGSTWALAKATLQAALTAAGAGGTVYMAHDHSEGGAADLTLTIPGTAAAPVRIICVDDDGNPEPPTTLATTGVVKTTGANALAISGGVAYWYGVKLLAAEGSTSSRSMTIGVATGAVNEYVFENCILENGCTAGSTPGITFFGTRATLHTLKNTTIKFNTTGCRLVVGGRVIWEGGSYDGSVAVPTTLLIPATSATADFTVRGVDLSAIGSSKYLVAADSTGNSTFVYFCNCKLGSGVGPINPSNPPVTPGAVRVFLDNCDSGDTNYKIHREDYLGRVQTETTIKRTGGASDGTTAYAWKLTSTADAEPEFPFKSPPILIWNESTGSAMTLTVEIIHDSATNLKDDEVWAEVEYLGTSGSPLSLFANDGKVRLAAAADQADSSESWTTSGMSNPNPQKLAVAFTPQEKGLVSVKVCVAKASQVVYVCPKISIA